MGWNSSVVTSSGIELLNESLAGHTLTITSAAGGAGVVELVDPAKPVELMAVTEVTDKRQNLKLLGIEECEVGKKIKIQITNEGVTEKYDLHQVGVFAKLSYQEEESLLFIMQDNRGVEIPTAEENPDFLFEMYAVIAISADANIKVNVSTSAVVSVGLLMESLNSVGGIKMNVPFSIKAEDWNEDPEPVNGYEYYYDVEHEKIVEDMTPMVTLAEASLRTAMESGMCPTATTYTGYVRLKTEVQPKGVIEDICNLMSEGGAVDISTEVFGNTVATDEEVQETLKEAFREDETSDSGTEKDEEASGEIATDEEVEETLNDIFGS